MNSRTGKAPDDVAPTGALPAPKAADAAIAISPAARTKEEKLNIASAPVAPAAGLAFFY